MRAEAWYLLAEMALVLAAVLGTHALRRRTSLVFCYAVLAFVALAGWALPHSPEVTAGFLQVSVESSVFFSAVLVAVFILYVADGPVAARMGIAVLLGTACLYLALAALLHAQFPPGSGFPATTFPLSPLRRALASSIAIAVDLVFMAVAWEAIQRAANIPLVLRVFATLVAVMAADTLTYVTLGWAGEAEFEAMLGGTLLSRVALSAVLSPIITAHLRLEIRRHGLRLAPRPMLSIVAREDLEKELISARHNLRIGAEALWESDERYRRMVEDIPTMVFRFTADGRVTYANRALCNYYDRSAEDILGTWVLAPIDKRERDALWARVQALRPDQPTLAMTAHAYPRPDDRRLQRWLIRGVFGPGDSGVAFQAVGEDITREAMLETRATRAEKMQAVGLLAGGIAHDFNNLLMIIWSCAELAQSGLRDTQESSPTIMKALRDIRRSADSAALMTRQLMAISRDEQTELKPVQLASVVSGALPLIERLLPPEVRLVLEDDGEPLPTVLADRTELERVLVNLIANARDAVDPKSGVVTVGLRTTRRSEDGQEEGAHCYAELRVQDNGCGMSEETRRRIFEPLFSTKGERGNGFGLATVYAIVQRSHAQIEVDSAPGEGSTFAIRFPCHHGPESDSSDPADRTSPARNRTSIWYCEGDGRVAHDVVSTLEEASYRVRVAADAQTLLSWVREPGEPPALVLTDSIAPGMPGDRLVAAVRERFPQVPAIFISGRPASTRPSPRGSDRTWFIRKPYRRHDLLSRVSEALRSGRASN